MTRSRAFAALATLLIAAVAHAQAPTSLADTWTGAIETPSVRLAIVVRLQQGDNGTWSGTIDIPQQGARAVPLAEITVKGAELSFKIAGPPGDPTLRLTLSDDGARLSGTLTQGGGTIPVSLARGDKPPPPPVARKRPQTPTPPFPYVEEQVTYRNETANVQLAGTLTRPHASGRYPAVLLITGSGQQDRDETLFEHKPFLLWADYLTRQGMAVLRVDDRGVGGSSRGTQTVTSNDFADDVRAGVAFLQKRPDIDGRRIGLVGHSEGAMLAAMVAANSPDIAFVVMLAGPGLAGDQILLAQAGAVLRAQGISDATLAWDRSLRERVFALLKGETDGKPNAARREALLEEIASARAPAPGVPEGAAARAQADALLKAVSDPWLRFFLAFDPRPTLGKVRCPVLAVAGERDVQVAPRENLPEIDRAVRAGGNKDVTVVTMPGLNHLFQTSTTGMPGEYATIEETISPTVLKLVTEWIVKRTS